MRLRETVVALLLANAVAFGQSSTDEHSACIQRVAELSRQFVQMQIEFTEYRVQWHQANMQRVEAQLARAVAERKSAEQEEKSNADDVVNVGIQLARNGLGDDEKAELQNLRTFLLGEGNAAVQQRQRIATEREALLRDQIAREKAAAEELQKRLQTLRVSTTR